MSSTKILNIIPARAGSKGLRNKNKKLFDGIPLFEHSIKISIALSEFYDITTVVASDDIEIIKTSKEYFPNINYERSSELSEDKTTMNETILDVISWAEENYVFEWILLMQPTSPQRSLHGIKKFIDFSLKSGKDNCYATVSPIDIKKYEILEKDGADNFKSLASRSNSPLRQLNSNQLYFEDGAGYMTSYKFIKENNEFINSKKLNYFQAHDYHIIDIDTLADFEIAEQYFIKSKND